MTAARRMEEAGMKREQAESGAEPLDPKTDVVAALRAMERRFYVALLVS